MHEKNAPEAIGVHPGEPASLPLPEEEDAQQERCIQQEEGHRAEEAALLGPFAEDEVRFLLRDEAVTGHGSLSPALPRQATRTDGSLRVPDVVVGVGIAHLQAEQHMDALLLVWTQDVLEGHVEGGRIRHGRNHDPDGQTDGPGPVARKGGAAEDADDHRPD